MAKRHYKKSRYVLTVVKGILFNRDIIMPTQNVKVLKGVHNDVHFGIRVT